MHRCAANYEYKVLIVNVSQDYQTYRRWLKSDRQTRYKIQQSKSTLEALEICAQEPPDCILLDWKLPNLNGEDFLQQLSVAQIPAIALVSQRNKKIVASITQDYLVKETLTKELLCQTVSHAIAQAELQQKLTEAETNLQNYELAKQANSQKENVLREQMEQQSFIMNITQQIRQSLNLDHVLTTAVSEVKRLLNCDRVIIFQFHEAATTVVKEIVDPRYSSIINMNWVDEHFMIECFNFYINNNPQLIDDTTKDAWEDYLTGFMKQANIKSHLAIPIIRHIQSYAIQEIDEIDRHRKNVELWGLLIVHSCHEYRQWQPEEALLLQQLGDQLEIAIQQANLYEQAQKEISKHKQTQIQLQQQVKRDQLIVAISQRIRSSLNLKEILNTTSAEIHQVLQTDRVLVYRLFADGTGAVIAESVSPEFTGVLHHVYPEEVFPKESHERYRQGKVYALCDASNGLIPPCLAEFLKGIQVKAKLVVPIIENDRLWGLLIAHQCSHTRQWQIWEIDLLQQLANQLVIAIQQAIHYKQAKADLLARQQFQQELQNQAATDRLLSEVTISINQSSKLDEILSMTLEKVREFLACDRIIIFQFASDWIGLVTKEVVSQSELSILGKIINDPCFATTDLGARYLQGETTSIDDVVNANLDPCYHNLLQGFQVRANLAAPIIHSDKLWGLLIVHQCDAPRAWLAREVNLIKQIAVQIGTAAQKERLYLQVINELSQKKVLLKEIHHRVKNNLQVMSSLLYMQFRNTNQEIKLLSEEYQNRIQSMALIHDQLYRSDDLSSIDFHQYVANLIENLFQCYGANANLIKTKLDINNIFLSLDQSIPLGLILNELVSNALKYAFPKLSGTINIQMAQLENQFSLTVADNGIGMPEDINFETSSSLGMTLVLNLTEQLEGEFTYASDSKNGSSFKITFPIS